MRTSMMNSPFRPRIARAVAATVLSVLALVSAAPRGRAQVNILTQHNDNKRTGQNLNETLLTTANVNSTQFGKRFAITVDGNVYAQPLVVSNVAIPGQGTHNVVYIATMHDSVYAFDADTGAQLWTVNKGPSIPNTEILAGNMNCTQGNGIYPDMGNEVGITSTPVIDLSTNTLYCLSRSHGGGIWSQTLHALDITTGAEKFGGPMNIPSSVTVASGARTFDLARQNQRSAITLDNGTLYICWASHGDCNPYNGFVMKFSASTLALQAAFCTSPSSTSGMDGIWMSGQGPAIDDNGNIYAMTGNGWSSADTGGPDYACAMLKLNSSLSISDWFVPFNVANLNANDLDMASDGPMLLPGTTRIVMGGKEGKIYLIDTANLGHFTAGSDSVIQSFPAALGHIHGSVVYWNSPVNGPTIYVWSEDDHLKAFKYTGGLFQTTPFSQSTAASAPNTMPGGFLSVSANGSTAGTGIVWVTMPVSLDANHASVPGILRAYDASNLTTELYDSYQNQARDDFGNVAKYTPPTVANGKVYVATFSNHVMVYGLLNPTVPPAPVNLAAIAGNTQISLTWNASTGATAYNVKRSTVNGGPYTTIASPAAASYTNTGLTNGTTYYYVVTALNAQGESVASNQASAFPTSTAPTVPTGLTATGGNAQVALTWNASAGANSYNVKRSTVSGSGYVAVASPVVNSYTNTGLTNGTTYFYVVSAVNAIGESANSAQASVTPQVPIPPAPTSVAAVPGNQSILVTWAVATGATTYNVKRSSVSGGPYSNIATGVATTNYSNTGLTNGTTYYYVVSAVNAAGESANSAQASATPIATTSINCGGGAASPFISDAYFSGGTSAAGAYTVNTTGVVNPAPVAVYQSERYGTITYTVPGPTAGASYKVRLHFTEDYWSASGQRIFNVTINGTQVLTNFDIYAAAGAQHKAIIQEFNVTANASGQVVILLQATPTSPDTSAKVDGIEVIPGAPTIPSPPTGLTATPGNTQVALAWSASSGATSYNALRSTVSGSGYASVATGIASTSYTNTGLTNGTTYFFVVTATNSAGTSGNSNQASATPSAAGTTIPFAATAPVIDGTADAVWSGASSYAIMHVSGTITNGADLTASWQGLWDSTNLYILTTVTDDIKKNDSTNPWDDDSAEIYLDADHNGGTSYDANDRQIDCGWGDAAPVEGAGRAIVGAAFGKTDPTGTSYIIEAKIPWAIEAFTPAGNAVIGIDVHVNDDDDGGARDGKLMWNDTTDTAWGNPSKFGSATLLPGGTPPPAPTGLTATPGNGQVALSWSASTGATSYNVLRSTVSGSGYASVATGIVVSSYTNTGLTNGTTYYFVVTATNANGTSGNSNQASATPTAGIPPAPTGLAATAGDTQIALTWNTSTGATSYNVKRSTVSGSGYVNVSSPTTTNYTNTGLTNGKAYFYVVSAVNASGESANSGQVSATPYSVAIAPATTAPVIDGTIDAIWNTATAYTISKVIVGTAPTGADCSGTFKALWDSTNLYVLFQVTDDVKVNDSTAPWDDDCVEVFIDGNYSHGTTYDGVDDIQWGFGWGDTTVTEGSGPAGRTTGITFAKTDPTSTTYVIEIKIPWTTIGDTASAGKIVGLDTHIDDDDDGGARDNALSYSDPNNTGWSNPSVFAAGRLN